MSIKPNTNITIRCDVTGIRSNSIIAGSDKIKGIRVNYPAPRAALAGFGAPGDRLCQAFHMFQLFHLFQPLHMFHLFQVFLKHSLLLKNETKRPDLGNFDPVSVEMLEIAEKCPAVSHPRRRAGRTEQRPGVHLRAWMKRTGRPLTQAVLTSAARLHRRFGHRAAVFVGYGAAAADSDGVHRDDERRRELAAPNLLKTTSCWLSRKNRVTLRRRG